MSKEDDPFFRPHRTAIDLEDDFPDGYLEHPRLHAKNVLDRHLLANSRLRRSMMDSFDEYVSIDSVCSPESTSRFEFIAEDGFKIERLYFDEVIRGVMVKFGRNNEALTRHIPLSWFCGVGKDGMLGQPITKFKTINLGERFIIEFENTLLFKVHIIGVLAGRALGPKA